MIPIVERRGWRRFPEGDAARRLASPLAWLWSLGARLAHAAADRGFPRAVRATIPVVSVGSLAFGGSGKTPIARWIARILASRGERPAVLLRGYRSGGGTVSRCVDPDRPDALRDGDEAALLASSLPGLPVVVGADRVRSARLAADLGATVAVLDDGHQHRRLARAMNLVIWDAGATSARAPRGTFLREPRSGLARADALLLVDRGDGAPPRPPEAPEHVASVRVRLVSRIPSGAHRGRPVYALTGIADPLGFERSLVRAGLLVTGATRHSDHHRFAEDEIADAVHRGKALGADALAITAKDHVRARERFAACGLDVLVFDLDAESPDEDSLAESIARAIGRRAS